MKDTEIKFDREKAWNRILTGFVVWFVIGVAFIKGSGLGISWSLSTISVDAWNVSHWIILAWAMLYGWELIMGRLKVKTLLYTIESGKLTERYSTITKTTNTARLQVVNHVEIEQGILDKLFNIFSVTVKYGFGDVGYSFSYDFLSEDVAKKVAEMIKPSKYAMKRVIE